jgi:DNA-binding transcriptional MerR regulator
MAQQAHADTAFKISTLAQLSGVSKELIHHYLREGLLPRPKDRARYENLHLRLLRLIKRLREERFLPLPVIREIVSLNQFDPDQIELVLLSGADPTGPGNSLPDDIAMSPDELRERAGLTNETLESYVELGLLRPSGSERDPHFHRHDLNLVSLLQRATQLGIPLDSFRTIRSYVEVAFELEQDLFLPPKLARRDLGDLAREFAVRKEVVTGFVVNVLAGLVNGLLYGFLDEAVRHARSVDESIYEPSEAFLRKHGLEQKLEQLRRDVGRRPDDIGLVRSLTRLFVVCGRYREAIFVADQARPRVPPDGELARLLGRALLLHGEMPRGIDVLEAIEDPDPVALAYLASAMFSKLAEAGNVEATLRGAQQVVQLVFEAVDASQRLPAVDRLEVHLVAGWILTSLSGARHLQSRGVEILEKAFEDCHPCAEPLVEPDFQRLRGRLTSAYLLHQCATTWRLDPPETEARREALRTEVFRIDPACEMARRLFLEPPSPPRAEP